MLHIAEIPERLMFFNHCKEREGFTRLVEELKHKYIALYQTYEKSGDKYMNLYLAWFSLSSEYRLSRKAVTVHAALCSSPTQTFDSGAPQTLWNKLCSSYNEHIDEDMEDVVLSTILYVTYNYYAVKTRVHAVVPLLVMLRQLMMIHHFIVARNN